MYTADRQGRPVVPVPMHSRVMQRRRPVSSRTDYYYYDYCYYFTNNYIIWAQ